MRFSTVHSYAVCIILAAPAAVDDDFFSFIFICAKISNKYLYKLN